MAVASLALVWGSAAQTEPPFTSEEVTTLVFPTDNTALLHGDGPAFYQYTDRRLQAGLAPPWTGGKYGFVRNGISTQWGMLYLRFHEGIDIKPLSRTTRGEPLDRVRSIADGIVVHASNVSRHSNYGRFVVVEHWWDGSPYYSLYAHLNEIYVDREQEVVSGEALGLLGYTGVGINRRRAHVHLEINLMLNQFMQSCYEAHFPDEVNRHGIFNGLNLAGVDVAHLYLRQEEDPEYSVRRLVEETPGFFSVTVPAQGMPDLLWRYPWLSPDLKGWLPEFGEPTDLAASWVFTFSRSGLPIQIEASNMEIDQPVLKVLEQTDIPYRYLTNGLLSGSGGNPSLARSGRRLVDFITCPAPELLDEGW